MYEIFLCSLSSHVIFLDKYARIWIQNNQIVLSSPSISFEADTTHSRHKDCLMAGSRTILDEVAVTVGKTRPVYCERSQPSSAIPVSTPFFPTCFNFDAPYMQKNESNSVETQLLTSKYIYRTGATITRLDQKPLLNTNHT